MAVSVKMRQSDRARINAEVNTLSKEDTYSLLLFALYKLHDSKEYATLSELSYILDENNLKHFLQFYGGTTITIPTSRDFRLIIDALEVYKRVKFNSAEFKKAYKQVDTEFTVNEIKKAYRVITKVLSGYSFKTDFNAVEFIK